MIFVGKTLALAIIQNVQKLAGGKNIVSNNGNAHCYSGRFPVSYYRFPASTLNVGRGFVHFLCLYTSEVLAGFLFGGYALIQSY